MTTWVRVCSTEEIPPGSVKEVTVGDKIVALFNVEGTVHAIDGICAHQGGPIGEGTVEGNVVTCPWHGWQYDVATGESLLNPNICQHTYSVDVREHDVMIDLG